MFFGDPLLSAENAPQGPQKVSCGVSGPQKAPKIDPNSCAFRYLWKVVLLLPFTLTVVKVQQLTLFIKMLVFSYEKRKSLRCSNAGTLVFYSSSVKHVYQIVLMCICFTMFSHVVCYR